MSSSKKQKNNNKKSNFFKDFIISGLSSTVGKTFVAPIERIKLLLQNQHILESVDLKYKGIVDCGKKVIRKEGILSLWRGNLTNVIRYFPNQALNFAFKDSFKFLFKKYDSNKEFTKFLLANSFSGGLAGAVSLAIVYPLDFIRTRLATDNMNASGIRDFNGSIDVTKKIIYRDGIFGLYRGYVIAVIGIIPYRALTFGLYDTFKVKLKSKSAFLKLIMAQLITNFTSLLVYPLDTIRRRIMLQAGKHIEKQNYVSSIDCSKKILLEEGYLGFYKGFGANIFRALGPSIVLVLYDKVHEKLELEQRGLGG